MRKTVKTFEYNGVTLTYAHKKYRWNGCWRDVPTVTIRRNYLDKKSDSKRPTFYSEVDINNLAIAMCELRDYMLCAERLDEPGYCMDWNIG